MEDNKIIISAVDGSEIIKTKDSREIDVELKVYNDAASYCCKSMHFARKVQVSSYELLGRKCHREETYNQFETVLKIMKPYYNFFKDTKNQIKTLEKSGLDYDCFSPDVFYETYFR
ncbi:hypothetical protein RLOatenuis_2900 [Rickettsiales bacterium]|nr:hypothetical protein RLOatenuis_2900 [Rickettsiales bacterium]